MNSVFITQPNYVPWSGWFFCAGFASHLVLLDTVQMTRQSWRSRNLLPTASGDKWLSIPLKNSGRLQTAICETRISSSAQFFYRDHWKVITQHLQNNEYFSEISQYLSDFYHPRRPYELLTELTVPLTNKICEMLQLDVTIHLASEIFKGRTDQIWLDVDPTERIAKICQSLDATKYLTSTGAMNYLDVELLSSKDIEVSWIDPVKIWSQVAGQSSVKRYSILNDIAKSGLAVLVSQFSSRKRPPISDTLGQFSSSHLIS